MTNYSLDGWLNSNKRLANRQTNEWIPRTSTSVIPEEAPPKTETDRDPSGSHASTSSENKNLFLRGFTPRKIQANLQDKSADKQENPVEHNPQRFTFRTPPMAGPSARLADTERMDHTLGSRISSTTAPDSTITKDIKESKAIREDFRHSQAKLTKVQLRLAIENNETKCAEASKKYKLKGVGVKKD